MNSEKLTEFIVKLKKDKKALLTVAVGITGMLLVMLSELPSFSSGEATAAMQKDTYISNSLEKDTEKLISEIRGAGKVSVMLTYDCSEETVWAKDCDEKIEDGGKSNSESKHIIIDSADGETGLAVKVLYPQVRGVAVVCTGGDDPVVKSEIKALLSALFDIGTNRISIAVRATEE